MKASGKEVEFTPYDTAEFLRTPEEIAEYLEAAFRTSIMGDSAAVLRALGTAARAYGMQKIAEATGLQRQGLYKSLSEGGNPSFETILKVMDVFGVTLLPIIKHKGAPGFSDVANDTAPKRSKIRKGKRIRLIGKAPGSKGMTTRVDKRVSRNPHTGELIRVGVRRKAPSLKQA